MIYQGITFVAPSLNILPDVRGTLITKDGVYKGEFRKGKAEGQGEFCSMPKNDKVVTYKGEWKNGILISGTIKNDSFKFKGTLENGIADGPGAIKFLKTNAIYKGNFKNGLYNTHGAKAVFKTEDYIY
jgi:hypothetical protein